MMDEKSLSCASLELLKLSDRIGNLPRRVYFPNGGIFCAADNDAIDQLWAEQGQSHAFLRFLPRLESSFTVAVVSLAVVVLLAYVGFRYWLPLMAQQAAQLVPQTVLDTVDSGALAQFDQAYFEPSELSDQRQQELRGYFSSYDLKSGTIEFRNGGNVLGANAFALPGGTIIFTDQMVELSQHDEELLAIYFHETGHVAHRHGVQAILQSSTVALLFTFLTGDGSGIAEALYVVPFFLLHNAYSRKFELSADAYAKEQMLSFDIEPSRFSDIMLRLQPSASDSDEFNAYFSTHPSTKERLQAFSGSQ